MFRVTLCILLALAAGCSEVGKRQIKVSAGRLADHRTVVVENSRIRVTFIPDLGGRLAEYTLKSTGHNELRLNRRLKAAAPDESLGGMEDRLDLEGKSSFAAPLARAAYTCSVQRTLDNVTVTLAWECPAWKLERSHTIFPDSTRVYTREVVTNLDDAPRALTPAPTAAFAVGGDADSGDGVLFPVEGATLVQRYSAPFDRDVPTPRARGWAGLIDSKKKEAVAIAFGAQDADEVGLRFDRSSCDVTPTRGPVTLAEGESASMSFDLFILSGKGMAAEAKSLPVAKKSAEEIAAALETFLQKPAAMARVAESDFYLTSWGTVRFHLPGAVVTEARPVTFRVTAYSAGLVPVSLDAALIGADTAPLAVPGPYTGSRTVSMGTVDVGNSISVDNVPDGAYRLILRVGDPTSGCRISEDIVVARSLRERIEKSRAGDADRFKPKYAAAKWHLEEAARVGEEAAGSVAPARSVYRKIDELMAKSRDILDGKAVEPKTGTFPKFYLSDIDDSAQGYLVTLPDNYTAKAKWPCVVYLRGRDPGGREFVPGSPEPELESQAAARGVVLVRPRGRGDAGYRGVGAEDVMSCLEQVRADYAVDPTRVYLMGPAEGGAGTWSIATRHPGTFAAVASVFGSSDLWLDAPARKDLPAWRQWWYDSNSPVTFAENLLNTGVYIYHSVRDEAVDVEHSRRMVERFYELGIDDFRYEEDPRGGHAMPKDLLDEVWNFLLAHALAPGPQEVSLVAPYLRYGRGGCVQMDAFERPCEFGEIRAKAAGQSVTVVPANVSAFTLDMTKDMVDVSKPVLVVVGSDAGFMVDRPEGKVSFHLESSPGMEKPRWARGPAAKSVAAALVKDAKVEGPMRDVFRSRFIVVPGTAGSPAFTEACRREAERYSRERWRRIQHVDCLIRADNELTAEDRAGANLILLGGPAVNRVTKELAGSLPVVFNADGSVVVDGKTLAAPLGAVAFVYPNPRNPAHYVLVLAPAAVEGVDDILDKARFDFDYYAFDARTRDTGDPMDARTAVLFGFFDMHWKFDKRFQWSRPDEGEPGKKLK